MHSRPGSDRKRMLVVFGTRPEAIKMAPLVQELKQEETYFEVAVCITAQHREMLDQVLAFFEIEADYDLDLMKPNQNLYSLTGDIITGLKPVLEDYKPDLVFVHGDTTTTMGASLAAFYAGSKVCHVEAGLRTFNKLAPFPEEMNRSITGRISDFHFAPTQASADNLKREGINEGILVTGNTVIDALQKSVSKVTSRDFRDDELDELKPVLTAERIILVTGHRRENHGEGFLNICKALRELALKYEDTQIVYPVHLNPNVKGPVYELLSDVSNIVLIPPLSYPAFVWLMNRAYLIITDSGGVQEEAPSLGKPVLVMRQTTERPEAVEAGTVKLVGTDSELIVMEASNLIDDAEAYERMSLRHNPYGDGKACQRIVDYLKQLN